jgi:hypothetical protein
MKISQCVVGQKGMYAVPNPTSPTTYDIMYSESVYFDWDANGTYLRKLGDSSCRLCVESPWGEHYELS